MTTTILTEIIGKTLSMVQQQGDEVTFKCTDGGAFRMWHPQDCCECVTIEEVTGDWTDLIGQPLLVAEERTSVIGEEGYSEIEQWTFYCFRTVKGSVDMRWCGTSNGYYSVAVSFDQIQ